MNNDPVDPLSALPMPDPPLRPEEQPFRLMLLRSKRSAAVGTWLVAVPLFFFACIVMKYFFHAGIGLVTVLEDTLASLDRSPGTAWLTPTLFAVLPAFVAALNLISITHVEHLRSERSLRIRIHLRWLNVLLAVAAIAVLCVTLLYLITENCR